MANEETKDQTKDNVKKTLEKQAKGQDREQAPVNEVRSQVSFGQITNNQVEEDQIYTSQ